MNRESRNRILSRLFSAPKAPADAAGGETGMSSPRLSREERIEHLKQLMEGMRTEVHVSSEGGWVEAFAEIVRKKGLRSLLYSPRTALGEVLEKYWRSLKDSGHTLPGLVPYEGEIEDFKEQLFSVEAAITTSKCAIADAGAIVLWPDEKEPRLMSLVPPVHFVVLDADTIYHDLSEAMEIEDWNEKMPANALLISGPSKTADIELILAFGVHGPKELIVFVVTGENNQDR